VNALLDRLASSGGPGLALAVILLIAVPSVAYLIKFLVDSVNREAARADAMRGDLQKIAEAMPQIASAIETLRSAQEWTRQEAVALRGNQDRIMDRVDRQVETLRSDIQTLGRNR
jgi:hypothetical protein